MGVYIKGMDMPKDCGHCLLCKQDTIYDALVYRCLITDRYLDDGYEHQIMKDCPLVPVPPHGRCIEEADAIETAWMILRGLGYLKEENPKLEQTVREVFATAPAIEVE